MNVLNWGNVRPGLYSAGQPAANDWHDIHDLGVRTVINLRPDHEQPGADEAGLVERAGMNYRQLPVASGAAIDRECVAQFADLLAQYGNDGLLVHCASGNRVGALFALQQHFHAGASVDDALAFGRRAGLTGLEARVRELMMDTAS